MKQMQAYLHFHRPCNPLQLTSMSEWLLCERRPAPTLPSFCRGGAPFAECSDTWNDDYASQALVPCLKAKPMSNQLWSGRPDNQPSWLPTTSVLGVVP